jgi:hypothetical protein
MELANPKSKHICNSHKPTHRPKIAKELALPPQTKLFLKNSQRFKIKIKIKIHQHTARKSQQTMTRKLNIDKAYNDTEDRRPAGNSTYPKVAVQWLNQALCFYQSLYLVDSEVLRNRHLRVAAKR